MNAPCTVVYDACVLYPAPLRDFLMQLALANTCRARWTNLIHDEWIRNVLKQRPDLIPADLARTRELMNLHARDALVTGFEYLIPTIDLPDLNDRHVVAAAVHAEASLIVTFNLKDFPHTQLQRYNVSAQHPDTFIVDLIAYSPAQVLEAAANHRRSLRNPPKSPDEYLDTLLKQGLKHTVALLCEWKSAL